MIPGSLAAKCVENILHERRQELARRLGDSFMAALRGDTKYEGRQRDLDAIESQLTILHELIGRRGQRFASDIDPTSLGWLCAWAAGHTEARAGLLIHLAAAKHPRYQTVAQVGGQGNVSNSDVIAEVMRAMLAD